MEKEDRKLEKEEKELFLDEKEVDFDEEVMLILDNDEFRIFSVIK